MTPDLGVGRTQAIGGGKRVEGTLATAFQSGLRLHSSEKEEKQLAGFGRHTGHSAPVLAAAEAESEHTLCKDQGGKASLPAQAAKLRWRSGPLPKFGDHRKSPLLSGQPGSQLAMSH